MQSTSRFHNSEINDFDPVSFPYSLVSNNVKINTHGSLILPVLSGDELLSFRDITYIANDEADLEEQEYVSVMGGEDIQLPKRRRCSRMK